MFSGDSRHSVDAKHRVFLPKRFQTELPLDADGSRWAVLTRGFEGCLYLFSDAGFERALERMDTDAFAGPEERKMQRLFFSHTQRVELDASGRLLLPEKLRRLAGIEREVVMIGVRDRVEIWAAERWEAYEAQNGDAFQDLQTVLKQRSGGRSS